MRVLVVNAGSSSLKLSVVDGAGPPLAVTEVERWDGVGHLEPVSAFLAGAPGVEAVGHRVVHGGTRTGPARLDDAVVGEIEALVPLAPLHNPRALAAVSAVGELLPDVPGVACFDTSFHTTLSPAARTYALPAEWNERWDLRRYGFHGLSHAYASRRGAELAGHRPESSRVVSCHLGAGASLAAVRDGRSVDTTMGFTPLAGLVMATRSGSVDPGVLLWLMEHGGLSAAELGDALEHRSGLRGLSGTSGDLRDVLAGREDGDAACVLAFDVFVHRLAREVAAMTAATGGLDVLVLTGGIGEHAWQVRAELAARLPHLGVAVEAEPNRRAAGDADISAAGAAVRTVVVTAREDLEVARQVRSLLGR